MRTIAVVVTGLIVGVLISFGQTHLAGEFRPLVDSASLWLLPAFVLGALMRTPRGSVAAGAVCALLQFGACTGTSALRGVTLAGTGGIDTSLLWFWVVCSAVFGPLFGAAGHLLRRGPVARRGLGGALLAATFIAEGVWNDFHELHDDSSGWLWVGIGLALCAALLPTAARLRWMAWTLPAMLVVEVGLTQIHR
jgi:Family of unknown function (DUF6518)